jgi:hypothetical protein
MSSIDITQIPGIVANDGYPFMFQEYEAQPVVYPEICEVRPCDFGLLGDKGRVASGVGNMQRVLDGQPIPADSVRGTRTWQIAVHRYGGRLDIPRRMLAAADASSKVPGMIAEFGRQWGRRAPAQKDQIVADIFQKGTIAAGNLASFDNTFPNEADANAGLIYDGKPFFAATGNGHPLLAGTSTPFNLIASAALGSTTLQTTLTAMRTTNAIDDRELKIMVQPTVLLVPAGLEYTAKTLVQSALVPGSGNNDTNTLQGILRPIVWRYLTDDTDAWWVGATGQGGGVRVYDSGMPVIEVAIDPITKDLIVTAEFVFGAGVTDWRQWFCNNKATS